MNFLKVSGFYFFAVLLYAAITLGGCKDDSQTLAKEEIDRLEMQLDSARDISTIAKLQSKYIEYSQMYSSKDTGNAVNYLTKAAVLYEGSGNYVQADKLRKKAVMLKFTAPETPANIINLVNYEVSKRPSYKEIIVDSIAILFPDKAQMAATLTVLREDMRNRVETPTQTKQQKETIMLNLARLNELMSLSEDRGELAAKDIMEAAILYDVMEKKERAEELYNVLVNDYQNSTEAPKALMLIASSAAENGETEVARRLYKSFMEKYPEHSLAISVEHLLKNLDKSSDEIVAEFEKRNRK